MTLLSLEEATARVLSRVQPMAGVRAHLDDIAGRFLAEELRAPRDLPAQDISMMDGYALRASDAQPGRALSIVLQIFAGTPPPARELQPGEAARIFTGAPMPAGADCVVMQEHADREGERVTIKAEPAVRAGQHIRRRGEEVRSGAVVLPAGAELGAAELSLAAACGVTRPLVHGKPRVAMLATGDELVPRGAEPGPGQIVETNTIALAHLVREAGGEPVLLGIAKDRADVIASAVERADAEILLTTGGASVGEHDHAQEALERLGGALVFHRVAIRPGKPVLFGAAPRGRLLFGMPGNPAAAMLCFELFARLAVRRLLGDPRPERPTVRAVLRGGPLSRIAALTHFPRGVATSEAGRIAFTPAAQQSSMQIGSWTAANALARLPPGEGKVQPGEELDVVLLDALR